VYDAADLERYDELVLLRDGGENLEALRTLTFRWSSGTLVNQRDGLMASRGACHWNESD
jgi:hypothetical protein